MEKKFVFDKKSGTLKLSQNTTIQQAPPVAYTQKENADMVNMKLESEKPNVDMNEPVVQFRQDTDYTILQINEERTNRPMMVIAGYGLEIKFNIGELRSTERIEQLLNGVSSLFRQMILEQALAKGESK